MPWDATGGEPATSWAELERRADAIRDLNGTPIDAAIRPVVIGLWAHGISTDFSCGGHVFEDDDEAFDPGYPPFVLPSVGIAAPAPDPHPLEVDPDDVRRDPTLIRAAIDWRIANHTITARLFALLERFYAAREVAFHARLQLSMSYGQWCCGSLSSAGADVSQGLPRDERAVRLALYQSEMTAFAAFLRATAPLPGGP